MSKDSHGKIGSSAVLVMICTLVSRILGYIRIATIGALFGSGGVADVINLVFSIPNNFRKLLAEGALSTAFIPELSRQIAQDPRGNGAKRLSGAILGIQVAVIVPMLTVSLIFPQQVLQIFEQFTDPEKTALSAVLFRWMIPYLLFVSVSAVMMAVHNTHGRFVIPALTPIVFSICVIGSLLIGHSRWGALSTGFGVLAGGATQVLLQYPTYRQLGYRLSPRFAFRDSAFAATMKKWVPMLLTSSLFVLNNHVAMLIASFLQDQSVSSLSYAIVFFQLPYGIFSSSITTVLYSRMSRQAAVNDRMGLRETLDFGYRGLWALLVPSAMALIVLGEPIIAVALQRRAFSASDTALTAQVLAAYCVGMPFIGLFDITKRAFYAMNQVRKSFYCALSAAASDIALLVVFIFVFDGGTASLAWANSLAFIFASVLQYLMIRRSIGFFFTRSMLRSFGKVFLGTGAGLAVIFVALKLIGTEWWSSGSSWRGLALLGGISILASGTILGLYFWMKVEAVSILFKRKGPKWKAV